MQISPVSSVLLHSEQRSLVGGYSLAVCVGDNAVILQAVASRDHRYAEGRGLCAGHLGIVPSAVVILPLIFIIYANNFVRLRVQLWGEKSISRKKK